MYRWRQQNAACIEAIHVFSVDITGYSRRGLESVLSILSYITCVAHNRSHWGLQCWSILWDWSVSGMKSLRLAVLKYSLRLLSEWNEVIEACSAEVFFETGQWVEWIHWGLQCWSILWDWSVSGMHWVIIYCNTNVLLHFIVTLDHHYLIFTVEWDKDSFLKIFIHQ